jgi:membrane associated rhomboid family serine protease
VTVVKRWAFWPLLALVCIAAASAALNGKLGSIGGTLVGMALSVPLAVLIERRRRRRWAAGRPRRLFP